MKVISWSGPWSWFNMPEPDLTQPTMMLKLDDRGIWIGKIIS